MILKIIGFDQREHEIECEHFEFRANHNANWLKFFTYDKRCGIINDVCVVESISIKEREE